MSRKKHKMEAKRVWLTPNDHETFSWVAYSVESYDENAVNLKIADCHRSVNIYMPNNRAGKAKFDRLLKILHEARGKMDEQDT